MTDYLDLLGNNNTVADIDYENDLKQKKLAWNSGLSAKEYLSEQALQNIANGAKKRMGENNYRHKKALRYQGKTIKEWAQQLGVTHSTIHNHINQYGHLDVLIADPTGKKRTAIKLALKDQYGKTSKELALELGCHPATIRNHLSKYGNLDLLFKYQRTEQQNALTSATLKKMWATTDRSQHKAALAESCRKKWAAKRDAGETLTWQDRNPYEWAELLDMTSAGIRWQLKKYGSLENCRKYKKWLEKG